MVIWQALLLMQPAGTSTTLGCFIGDEDIARCIHRYGFRLDPSGAHRSPAAAAGATGGNLHHLCRP